MGRVALCRDVESMQWPMRQGLTSCTQAVLSVMVRSMSRAVISLSCQPRAAGFVRYPFVSSVATLALAIGMTVFAGCATKSPSADGRASSVPSKPSDRDGAPTDAPPDLATLPDPEPRIEPIKPNGPNKPYSVLGQAYEPLAKDVSWKEKGQASWYGTKFHGRKTASGEMFSMYGFTAAHRTLPIPSYARVRHAQSGKEIIVRINDRGPFHSARVIDLSYAAAVKLGIVSSGSAPVEIERLTFDEIRTGAWKRGTILDPDAEAVTALPLGSGGDSVDSSEEAAAPSSRIQVTRARALTTAGKGFWVQFAALGKRDSIERLQQKVSAALADLTPMLAIFREASYFKLQAGPYESRREAVAAAEQAREALQLTPMVVERR